MSETGQPRAATPEEYDDGTGRPDDLTRTGGGWAPPATGWPYDAEASGGWPRSGLATGWGASSSRHGDLPAPLSGPPVEKPSGRANGHQVNGVYHAGEEPSVSRQAPVSAPPAAEPRREADTDRLAVPAQRPAPGVERPAADAGMPPARHFSDEAPGGRVTRWEPGFPSSAPPAQRDAGPAEEPRATAGDDRRGGPADERHPPPADEAQWPGPNWNRPSWGGWAPPWAREEEPVGRRTADPVPGDPRRSPEPAASEHPSWAGPSVPARPFSAPPHAAPTAGGHGSPDGGRWAGEPPYTARRSAPESVPMAEPVGDARPAEPAAVLPQRVPAEPDVPVVPEPPAVEPSAETPELARIATHLRRDDEPAPPRERPEGFDVNAILDAVREVAGVRDAALRRTPAGAHSLRLDLADGADPAEVSRLVARLLQERMGLAAAPQNLPGTPAGPLPPVRRRSAAPRVAPPRPTEDRAGATRPVLSRSTVGQTSEDQPAAAEIRSVRPVEDPEPPRRRRPAAHRGRATVEESSLTTAPTGASAGGPAALGTSYSGAQMTTTETAPSRPLNTHGVPGPRVVIDQVQVSTFGLDATVEVLLRARDRTAEGHATGPAVDGYVLRLCAVAAAAAVDELLGPAAPTGERGRCFVEHAAVMSLGTCEVATVVVLLVCDGWVEQLAGSALVAGDPRQAAVRATLAAVNRRLEALLA